MVGLKLFHRAAMTFISCWLLDTSLIHSRGLGPRCLQRIAFRCSGGPSGRYQTSPDWERGKVPHLRRSTFFNAGPQPFRAGLKFDSDPTGLAVVADLIMRDKDEAVLSFGFKAA
jgi:hypothetical protein